MRLPGNETWAIEIKRTTAPKVSRGLYTGADDIKATHRFLVYSGTQEIPMSEGARALPLAVAVNLPADAGLPYLFGLSATPGLIPLLPGDCRSVPLAPDALFLAWFNGLGAAIPGAFGTVSPTGAAQTTFNLPSTPLGGIPVTFALVTIEANGVALRTVTDPLTLTLP